jgi:type IV pilus assembly protein PilA
MKRGFTLIELLAVIVVLGLIAVVITPVITDTLNDSREDAYQKQVDNLIKAANTWSIKNPDKLPSTDNKIFLSLDTLTEDGIVEDDEIINPKTRKKMEGCISISYSSTYNQYEYKYISDNNSCK